MAANYWTSTQYEFTKSYTPNSPSWHKKDIDSLGFDSQTCALIECYYLEAIWNMCGALLLRPRIAATASVYFRKFYLVYSFVDAEPSLVAGTAVNLAGKIEECPIRMDSLLTSTQQFATNYTASDIQSCEFYLLDALKCNLIVYHPYRSLLKYKDLANLEPDFMEYAIQLVNDSYFSDALLRYPPFLIALAALIITRAEKSTTNNDALSTLFSKLDLESLRKLGDITSDIFNVYSLYREMVTRIQQGTLQKHIEQIPQHTSRHVKATGT